MFSYSFLTLIATVLLVAIGLVNETLIGSAKSELEHRQQSLLCEMLRETSEAGKTAPAPCTLLPLNGELPNGKETPTQKEDAL
jgi:hypothetical protein